MAEKAPKDPCNGALTVFTGNGEVFSRSGCANSGGFSGELHYLGNFWSGGAPTNAKPETWGSVKARYK